MREDYITIDWRVLISVLAAAVCVLVVFINKWIGGASKQELQNWRMVGLGFIAFLTAIPYMILSITAGWVNFAYFLSVWCVFLMGMRRATANLFVVLPFICGVMLSFPASRFVYVDRGVLVFLRNGVKAETFTTLAGRVVYFVALMMLAYLTLKRGKR